MSCRLIFGRTVPDLKAENKLPYPHIYAVGELPPQTTVKKYLTVQQEGRREVQQLEQ